MAKNSRFEWDKPADDNPPAHDFDKEEIIEGVVTRTGAVPFADREAKYLVIDVPTEGERTVWLSSVLETAVERLNPQPGDYIGIKYLGKRKSANGFYYRDYDVRVLRD